MAYSTVITSRQQGKSEYFRQYMQEWKLEMYNCRNTENEMRILQRCGCNMCRDKYYRLEKDIYRSRDYYHYGLSPLTAISPPLKAELKMTETKVVIEEPKNIAVKILVDKLKAEQGTLTSAKSNLESYKNYVKTYTASKLKAEKNIKELSVALKKLGHKE